MNKQGLGWIGAVLVLAAGGLILFVLLQVQSFFQQHQTHTLKQMQGITAAPASGQDCDPNSGKCPLPGAE